MAALALSLGRGSAHGALQVVSVNHLVPFMGEKLTMVLSSAAVLVATLVAYEAVRYAPTRCLG
eukprot:5542575-Alexandrium_andersonii.AAC.1